MRGNRRGTFSYCRVSRASCGKAAAADAYDAVFAGVVVWKPLQLMLMMLLLAVLARGAHSAEFAGILVWKLLQLMLMMRCLQGLLCGSR